MKSESFMLGLLDGLEKVAIVKGQKPLNTQLLKTNPEAVQYRRWIAKDLSDFRHTEGRGAARTALAGHRGRIWSRGGVDTPESDRNMIEQEQKEHERWMGPSRRHLLSKVKGVG